MMRLVLIIVFTVNLLLSNQLVLAAELALTVEQAIDIAIKNNPSLKKITAHAQAKATVPSQAGSLPDPYLNFTGANLPTNRFDTSAEPMTQFKVGISQSFPFWGKLDLKKQAAEYDAAVAAKNTDELRLLIIRDVRHYWWNTIYLTKALEIIGHNQILLKQFVEIAQTKYKVGKGLQQDVLLAQVELSKLMDKAIQFKQHKIQAVARLNALLNRDANQSTQLSTKINEALASVITEDQLYVLAQKYRPLLAAGQNQIHAAKSRLDLANKQYYPDFKLGADYGKRDGNNNDGSPRTDFVSIKFSVSLPLFAGSKQDKAVAQHTSALLAQQHGLQATTIEIKAQISQALAAYQNSKEQVDLYKQAIIPQTKQAVAAMLTGYQVSKVDFLNLVNTQMTLFNYEIKYWQVFMQAQQALARLIALVGQENLNLIIKK